MTSRVGAGRSLVTSWRAASGQCRRRTSAACDLGPVDLPTVFAHPARFDFRTRLPDASHRTWRRLVARAMRVSEKAEGTYQHAAGRLSTSGNRSPYRRRTWRRSFRGRYCRYKRHPASLGHPRSCAALARRPDRHRRSWVGAAENSYSGHWVLAWSACRSDHNGIVVDALPRGVRAVYVTPSHQYPLAVTMTLARRQALLAWAERNDAATIEDDYDSEFRFGDRPVEPLEHAR